MRPLVSIALLIGYILLMPTVLADEFRPALLEITETGPEWYSVRWKVPLQNGQALAISPKLPQNLEQMGPASVRVVQGSEIRESYWRTASGSLVGGAIEIEGLRAIAMDVIVQIKLLDGREHSTILRPASAAYVVPERATKWRVAGSYWKIGTIHILEGFDHLLFLLTLLLIVNGVWPLLKTVTAFTLAHSLTLALATLGVVTIPSAPTEAVISLSIVLLAVEVLRKNRGELTMAERFPWLVAFVFGLVHGLGFAGALSEIGVPENEVPLALLMFNVGVETGQILFVLAVSVLLAAMHRIHNHTALTLTRATPYVIGGLAAFWTIERTVNALTI